MHHVMGRSKEALQLSSEYLEHALVTGSEIAVLVGHRIHACALLNSGDVAASSDYGRQALQRYVAGRHRTLHTRFDVFDQKVATLSYLAVADALAGHLDQARANGQEAIANARRLNHINSLAFALFHSGVWLPSVIREPEALQGHADELLELVRKHRLRYWGACAMPYIACVGRPAAAAGNDKTAQQALDVLRHEFNSDLHTPQLLCHLAENYLASGGAGSAHQALIEAEDLMQRQAPVYWRPEGYRLRAKLEIMQGQNRYPAAVDRLQAALDLTAEQGSKLLQLRAAVDLARLQAEHGERDRARNQLIPIYDRFTEGFDTADLKNAKALLDELA
jgi:adenylate cyclase